jgi:hypothetical protein
MFFFLFFVIDKVQGAGRLALAHTHRRLCPKDLVECKTLQRVLHCMIRGSINNSGIPLEIISPPCFLERIYAP